jgi:hypothetical protein
MSFAERLGALIGLMCAFMGVAWAAPTEDNSALDAKIELYASLVASHLPERAQDTLHKMDGVPRRLLASRSYLRAGERIDSKWSWTTEQIEAFTHKREYRELLKEVAAVRARFEEQNPGYSLYANTNVRSLDTQLARWNSNRYVGRIGLSLERAAKRELRKPEYKGTPDAATMDRFAAFLRDWHPTPAAPLATPGLSLHGQLRAIDFQVVQGGKTVALADIAVSQSIWEDQGWSAKLQNAMANTHFVGPLQSPHEPWHYEYVAPIRTADINKDPSGGGAIRNRSTASR